MIFLALILENSYVVDEYTSLLFFVAIFIGQ